MKNYYVYIITNKTNGTLYIGLTDEIERRMREHKEGGIPGFATKYSLDKLVYYEDFYDHHEAFLRERRMKKWKRAWKVELIEKNNCEWHDLAVDWS